MKKKYIKPKQTMRKTVLGTEAVYSGATGSNPGGLSVETEETKERGMESDEPSFGNLW
jgi:hypothetical protein